MSTVASPTKLFDKYAELVVLPHSVFALPFALSAFWLAGRGEPDQLPLSIELTTVLLIIVAVVAARTAAMAFNRLVDRDIDAANPRTSTRLLPLGKLSTGSVWKLVLGASAVFFIASALLGMHCLVLSPFVLAVLLGYSFTKRFTSYSHLVLGLSLALAPGGAWWVLRPEISITPIVLMVTVVLWVAGFDILYSCQDISFDRKQALHSVPAALGIERALKISLILHLLAAFGFMLVGRTLELPTEYMWGVAIIAVVLVGQHFVITAKDISRINRVFFTFNGVVSIAYFILVLWTLSLPV